MALPIFQMRKHSHRAPVTCKAPPSSQGWQGSQDCSNWIVPSPTKASELSCALWLAFRPCDNLKLLLVTAHNSSSQSVLETGERGKVSVLPRLRVPSLQVPHLGLSP